MSSEGLTSEEIIDRLQLERTPRIGPVTFFQLVSRFGSAAAALRALPSRSNGRTSTTIAERALVELEIAGEAVTYVGKCAALAL